MPVLPTPRGDNVVIITGAGGSGVLLSDAVTDNGLSLMEIPPDLDEAFRRFIPPFGAAGNPVDITGGEPPSTYEATIRLGLADPRVHALVLGYWHTVVTPPAAFAELTARVVAEFRERGVAKPVVASLAGDVEVEEACRYLFERGSWRTRTRPRCRWRCWVRSTGGRGRPDCWGAVHEVSERDRWRCAPPAPGSVRAGKAATGGH